MDAEHEHDDVPGQDVARAPQADHVASVRTGHPDVDEVLGSLDALDDRPVSEHVAVFEAAHDRLRAALSSSAEAPAARPAGDPVPQGLRPGTPPGPRPGPR